MKATCIYNIIFFVLCWYQVEAASDAAENHAKEESENDSLMVLLVVALLILTVLTIWLFKVRRFRFVHESGLCIFYGMIAGAVIRYTGNVKHRRGVHIKMNVTEAPLTLWAYFSNGKNFSYERKGLLHPHRYKGQEMLETKAVFDPEVFFYALLPPIIFFAGYDMKKRFFFRNLGAILTFAFLGTTISCMVFGTLMYGFVSVFPRDSYPGFNFHESILFGSLISATDPVTVLSIFNDLNVEVDLYAIIFGESVMNDAVAIVLYRSVLSYQHSTFTALSFFEAVGGFIGIFGGSFLLGSAMGLGTALLTKLTKIGQFPVLETALFSLMSYSTFLIAESVGLTGIVTVLFCGISQAHYTFNNLTDDSKLATKQIFGLLNFLAENFIFIYMGLTVFTFEDHHWDPGFIAWTFVAIAISRAFNIYPLSFILNIKRSKKIEMKSQHMLWFSGLRGAVAFALAIRNTEDMTRQIMLTSVLVVAIVTVVINGGLTTQALSMLKIRVNVDPNEEITRTTRTDESGNIHVDISYERSWLVRKWHEFDVRYMKPLFTTGVGPQPTICGMLTCCQTKTVDGEMYVPAVRDSVASIDEEMIDITASNATIHTVNETGQIVSL